MTQEPEQIFLLNHSESQSQFSFDYRRNCTANSQENLENVKDFSNVCRTCAAVTEYIIPIFDGEGLQNKLAEKIHQHLPIKVSEQDSLPRVVCYQCASTLLAWHELVKCCLQADEALKTKQAVWAAEASVQEKPGTSDDATIKELDDPASQDEFNHQCKTMREIRKMVEFCFQKRKESSSLTYACQECDWKTLYGPAILTDHLHKTHSINMTTRDAVIEFIENNVTIVELLESDEDDLDFVEDENIETLDILEDCADLSKHLDFVKSTNTIEKTTKKYTKAKINKVNVTEYPCSFCESVFTSPTRLVCHTAQHQEVTINEYLICNICNLNFDGKKDFVQHLMSRHPATTATSGSSELGAKCRGCGFVATSSESLQVHIKQNHETTEPKKIKKKYMKPAPVECPHCKNTFSDKSNLKAHIARQHGGEAAARWACGHCHKTYRSAQSARLHAEAAHAGTLRHVCAACGEAFVRRAELHVHARTHSGDAPYRCVVCSAAFRARDSLTKHMHAHLDVRKYACVRCPKRFRNASHLKRHVAALHDKHNKETSREKLQEISMKY